MTDIASAYIRNRESRPGHPLEVSGARFSPNEPAAAGASIQDGVDDPNVRRGLQIT